MLPKILLAITLGVMSSAVSATAGSNVWNETYVKRLDGGYLEGPLSDPEHPPTLELIFLSWDGIKLRASGDYTNLTSLPVEVTGRKVKDEVVGSREFYPCATLEVSDHKTGGWRVIGSSPSSNGGEAASVTMAPNSLDSHPYNRVPNRSCYIDMDAFRGFIGKAKYGRVVLKNGATSQLLVLTDLLPNNEEGEKR